ncbi:hypothetical protein OA340_00185 [Paracoccaceae bacterium]|nr:hypothetical protein [Paracoccaceae bacterium]
MMVRRSYFIFALLLIGCQTDLSSNNQVVKGNSDLKISDGVLDLSQFSQEQQKVEREQAAIRREALKAGRVVLEADGKEKIGVTSVNLALFARNVSNKVGEKIYFRNFLGTGVNSACKKFLNKNAAQIFFLKNGGPKNDYHNIDPDGDGFACKWNPEIYRKIDTFSENKEPSN